MYSICFFPYLLCYAKKARDIASKTCFGRTVVMTVLGLNLRPSQICVGVQWASAHFYTELCARNVLYRGGQTGKETKHVSASLEKPACVLFFFFFLSLKCYILGLSSL